MFTDQPSSSLIIRKLSTVCFPFPSYYIVKIPPPYLTYTFFLLYLYQMTIVVSYLNHILWRQIVDDEDYIRHDFSKSLS